MTITKLKLCSCKTQSMQRYDKNSVLDLSKVGKQYINYILLNTELKTYFARIAIEDRKEY